MNEEPIVGTEVEPVANKSTRGRVKRTPIVDAILSNEVFKGLPEYKSVRELAEIHNCLPSTVYSYRTRLGLKKMIDVANNGQRHTEKNPVPLNFSKSEATTERNRSGLMQSYTRAAVSTDDLVRSLEGEGIISPIDRLKMLSRMIRVGSPMVKLAAIKTLEELSKNTEGRVGPPVPLTEEERITRMTRLMLGIGQTTVQAAYDIAFPSKEEPETEVQPYAGDLSLTIPEDPGQMPDLPGNPLPTGG